MQQHATSCSIMQDHATSCNIYFSQVLSSLVAGTYWNCFDPNSFYHAGELSSAFQIHMKPRQLSSQADAARTQLSKWERTKMRQVWTSDDKFKPMASGSKPSFTCNQNCMINVWSVSLHMFCVSLQTRTTLFRLAGEISEQDDFYVSCLYGWEVEQPSITETSISNG